MIPDNWPISINAVSGYSGGGKAMIAEFEDVASPNYTKDNFRLYGLGLEHKHVTEIEQYSLLAQRPLFAPAIGRYAQGMLVEVPLHLNLLPGAPSLKMVHETIAAAYEGERFVTVASLEESAGLKGLDPEGLNGTNNLKLFVFGSGTHGQARLVALLDNLGKGASGQVVQCMNIMIGADEGLGVEL